MGMKKQFTLEHIDTIAEILLQKATSFPSDTAVVVALTGDLGAGKTTLTQAVGRVLGIKNAIISPTFVIMKRYEIAHPRFKTLVHIDAYRLTTSEELLRLGWADIVADPSTLVIVEWPERVKDCLRTQAVLPISLTHIDEKNREIEFP
jgi:tRNA threonylcarbamoyladenosine biosynthesis protein TsaE